MCMKQYCECPNIKKFESNEHFDINLAMIFLVFVIFLLGCFIYYGLFFSTKFFFRDGWIMVF